MNFRSTSEPPTIPYTGDSNNDDELDEDSLVYELLNEIQLYLRHFLLHSERITRNVDTFVRQLEFIRDLMMNISVHRRHFYLLPYYTEKLIEFESAIRGIVSGFIDEFPHVYLNYSLPYNRNSFLYSELDLDDARIQTTNRNLNYLNLVFDRYLYYSRWIDRLLRSYVPDS